MHRVFIDHVEENRAHAGADEARHLKRVLRMSPGGEVELLDGHGGVFLAEIVALEDGGASFDVLKALPSREPSLNITLYQGLSKPDHMDLTVQKGTELGVTRFVIFPMERSIGEAARKRERWQRIAREAAKQCGRGRVPDILVEDFGGALKLMREQTLLLMPWELGGESLTSAVGHPVGDAGAVIGPEGGITKAEAAAMREVGAKPVTLGARILRTETAGIAVTTALLLLSGDMDDQPVWP